MFLQIFKSKIHRVKVTQAELNYVGSITIDEDLLDASNIIVGERVQVVNVNNGARFETYVLKGERKSGIICVNGAAARKVAVGDIIIIIAYIFISPDKAKEFMPVTIFPDENNRVDDSMK
jgi:aspartate 1-decarboxylase